MTNKLIEEETARIIKNTPLIQKKSRKERKE